MVSMESKPQMRGPTVAAVFLVLSLLLRSYSLSPQQSLLPSTQSCGSFLPAHKCVDTICLPATAPFLCMHPLLIFLLSFIKTASVKTTRGLRILLLPDLPDLYFLGEASRSFPSSGFPPASLQLSLLCLLPLFSDLLM